MSSRESAYMIVGMRVGLQRYPVMFFSHRRNIDITQQSSQKYLRLEK